MDHEPRVEPVRLEAGTADGADTAGRRVQPPSQAHAAPLPWHSLTGSGGVHTRRSLAELNFDLDILSHRTRDVLAGLDPGGSPDERALYRLTERLGRELDYLQALASALRAG
jgi:hypothetical protein